MKDETVKGILPKPKGPLSAENKRSTIEAAT